MLSSLRGSLTPLGVASAAGNGLLNGLVAYWPMNEAGGANNALDLHGGLTLTQVSSPGSAAGKVYAGARTFDGSADYFTRANEAALQAGDIDFVIAAWIYHTSNGYQTFFAKSTTDREFAVMWDGITPSQLTFMVSANGTAEVKTEYQSALVTQNAWHLVIAWHDSAANTINIQMDAQAPATKAHTTGVYVGTNPIDVGRWGLLGRYWAGRLGPVAFWKNRVLDATARAALWNGGDGLAYSAFTL